MAERINRFTYSSFGFGLLSCLLGIVSTANAVTVPFQTTQSKDYLLISKAIQDGTDSVTVTGGGSGNFGRNTLGWVRELPDSAVALPSGISSPVTGAPTYDGDTALLDEAIGEMNFSDLDVYGDLDQGVVGKASIDSFTDNQGNLSNSQFDNNDGGGLQNFAVNRGLEQFAPAGSATTAQNVDLFAAEINAARSALMTIEMMAADVNIVADGSGNIKDTDQFVTLPKLGLNIVKFTGVGANDITIDSVNLVFQAPAGATPGDRQAVVFVPDTANFKTTNGNILVGDNMGLMDVVFVSFREDNATHFDFSNTVLNGVAFWDLFREVDGNSDVSEISLSNVSGCTQFLGDKIALSSEIHLANCGFRGVIPEPSSLALLGLGGLALGAGVRRRR